MGLRYGGPGNTILAKNALETHILLVQRTISTAQWAVVGKPGLVFFIAAFPCQGILCDVRAGLGEAPSEKDEPFPTPLS